MARFYVVEDEFAVIDLYTGHPEWFPTIGEAVQVANHKNFDPRNDTREMTDEMA